MVDVMGVPIPFDLAQPVASTVNILVQTAVTIIAIMIADAVIEHGVELKNIAILAFVSYFVTPIVGYFLAGILPAITLILPVIVWVILSELLLKGVSSAKNRAIIAILGYAIFLILQMVGVAALLFSVIQF